MRASASSAARQRTGGIQLDEARKILDVEDGPLDLVAAQKKYDHLFEVNGKEKGGSFYLQSKVYRAMERLKYEMELREGPKAAGATEGGAEAASK